MLYQNISSKFFSFRHKSTRVTDGRTERQNYDPQDRASIGAARGKNQLMLD